MSPNYNLSWSGPAMGNTLSVHDPLGNSNNQDLDELEHTAYVGTTFYRSPEMEGGTSGYYTDKVLIHSSFFTSLFADMW